ncbi:DUF421 domain-containing protein [Erythrobacter sp. HKB08]|uniref:DUF421 domain-containing protein n=1 Tax=Erythrobacter sp. HKB08 TaxID=2502843 RepID=UPI001008B398|nr:YetF domain-containing protein [Erythrobacter sp. HKB08]
MFFSNWPDTLNIFLTALTAYVAVVIVLRFAGKRSLSKMNAFDLVVTVALGSILASVIVTKSLPVSDGVVAFASLCALQLLVTWLSNKSETIAKAVRSEPKLLLRDGEFQDEALANERVTRDEVEAAIRKDGHGRVEEITAVVLESDGSMSVIVEGKSDDCTALRSVLKPGETSL